MYTLLSSRCSHGMVSGEEICDRVLRTATQMMADRGFSCACDLDAMKARVAKGKAAVASSAADGRQCILFLDREERIGVKTVRTLQDEHQGAHLVCIAVGGPTPFTKREMASSDVSFFNARELMHNVTTHSLVPKHEALSAAEVADVRAQYNMLDSKWPKLLTTDPVVRYYNWPVGTIVRIRRTGISENEQIFYRQVVHTPS